MTGILQVHTLTRLVSDKLRATPHSPTLMANNFGFSVMLFCKWTQSAHACGVPTLPTDNAHTFFHYHRIGTSRLFNFFRYRPSVLVGQQNGNQYYWSMWRSPNCEHGTNSAANLYTKCQILVTEGTVIWSSTPS